MPLWLVYTPEYETHSMSWDPPEPPEYGADAVEIEAQTRRDAIAIAVQLMLREDGYCQRQRQDGCSPYAGVQADELHATTCVCPECTDIIEEPTHARD